MTQENWKEDLVRENYPDKWLVLLIEKLLKKERNKVLSEVEKSFENLHEEYTVDYTNHDILKIINNLK